MIKNELELKQNEHEELFYKILATAIKAEASDIHLTDKLVPAVRVNGVLRKLGGFPVNNPESLAGFVKAMLDESQIDMGKDIKTCVMMD